MDELHKRMKRIVINEGTESDLEMLNHHLEGKMSKESIIQYSKLIGQANATMEEKVKLPAYHYGAFRGLYKDYYRD